MMGARKSGPEDGGARKWRSRPALSQTTMAETNLLAHPLLSLIFALVALGAVQPAEAADAGNVIAGLTIAIISILFVCAGLGWWSRRRG